MDDELGWIIPKRKKSAPPIEEKPAPIEQKPADIASGGDSKRKSILQQAEHTPLNPDHMLDFMVWN